MGHDHRGWDRRQREEYLDETYAELVPDNAVTDRPGASSGDQGRVLRSLSAYCEGRSVSPYSVNPVAPNGPPSPDWRRSSFMEGTSL